ncbi:sensor histidine kinase [Neobacillus sp. D3-1R]|uniref:sensor histidine kinase n=1 Tax=Neobacillus sp. D3-1R TaxID=3445778 RepID=UPI003FA194C4
MKKGKPFILKLPPFNVKMRLITYTMLVLIPVIIFCLVYQYEAKRILKEKAGTLIVESLELSTSWLDEVLSGAVRISAAVGSDRLITQYILDQQGTLPEYENVINTVEASKRLMEILNTETRVTSVWIYIPEKRKVLSTEYGYYSVTNDVPLEWLKNYALKDQMQAWLYPNNNFLNAKSLIDLTGLKNSPTNITFVRILPGVGTEENPIIIGTTYHKYTVEALLNEVSLKTKSSVFLYNQTDVLVNRIGEKKDLNLSSLEKKGESYTFHNQDLITYSTSPITGWKMVASAPIHNYMSGLSLLNSLIFSFMFIVILLSIYSARALTKGFHDPLTELLRNFKKMEQGNLSTRMKYTKRDEFGEVADGFNQMANIQEHLIRSVYEERIAKQEAELNFLTSQINPHFLYNTLAALYSMAKKVDATLANALIAMSRLFRFSLSDGKDMVSINESIQLITYYIDLLNIRNPGKYKLEVFVEPEAQYCKIPKLIIQPIVENAVKHGIEKANRQGVLSISVTLLSNDLLIMISDNGIGMDKEKLFTLREKLKGSVPESFQQTIMDYSNEQEKGTNYALLNIFKRLQLKYNQDFQLSIDSELGKGTTITYRLKKEE